LSLRQREGALLVAESIEVADGKTKTGVATLTGLGLDASERVLVVLEASNPGVERALRNLRWASVLLVAGLNTYDILRHKKLVLTRGALEAIHARLSAEKQS
jgi:large subunit ribosomal protein L4